MIYMLHMISERQNNFFFNTEIGEKKGILTKKLKSTLYHFQPFFFSSTNTNYISLSNKLPCQIFYH